MQFFFSEMVPLASSFSRESKNADHLSSLLPFTSLSVCLPRVDYYYFNFKKQKSVLPKIERARDAIRSHNDFLFDGSHGGEKNVTSSLEQLSIDFRVKSSLCATTSNALDACAKELGKCVSRGSSRSVVVAVE
jgi:hypothetical protein